jgi:hypothetical protein
MRKLEALKVGGVQREEEKGKKLVMWVGKLILLLVIFSLIFFICNLKMISRAWGNNPITF